MSYYSWKPYVPVAERRAKALRKMEKLKKKGLDIQPIQIEKRKIAKTFWGKAWCEHIESFSDYENRLPRGRTYVRNGSVCHLAVEKGKISAIVSGSQLYNITITIQPLLPEQWEAIKTKCSGQIGSLLELLSGQLSDSVMSTVCHQKQGLFPTPNEINLSCDCPDWAIMCKHVAAVLYGIGARLDHMPHQLFLLRGVDHNELVDVSIAITEVTQEGKAKRKRIDGAALSDIFGIEFNDEKNFVAANKEKPRLAENNKTTSREIKTKMKTSPERANKQANKSKKIKSSSSSFPVFPVYLTGNRLVKKRKSLALTQTVFAKKIGVCPATISKWEREGRKKLKLKKAAIKKLQKIWGG